MKNIKFLKLILIIIAVLFIGTYGLKAMGPIKQSGDIVKYNGIDELFLKSYYRYNDYITVYGIGYDKNPPLGEGLQWEDDNTINENLRIGIAEIIRMADYNVEENETASEEYYYAELAINELLCNNGYKNSCRSDSRKTQEILGDYYYYYYIAENTMFLYESINKYQSVEKLDFVEEEDYYITSMFELPADLTSDYVATDLNIGEVIWDGHRQFQIKVPKSEVGYGSTVSVKFYLMADIKFPFVEVLDFGDNYQMVVTPEYINYLSLGDWFGRGTITRDKAKVQLNIFNVDKEGYEKDKENPVFLRDSVLLFQTAEERNKGESGLEYNLKDGKITIENVEEGTYYLCEKEPPTGYNRNTTCIEIAVSKSGDVTVNNEKMDTKDLSANIYFESSKTKTRFNVINAANDEQLAGAKLVLLDSNKEVIMDLDGNVLFEWMSKEQPYYITGLPVGKYYLKQLSAPKGFAISEELVEFEVKNDIEINDVFIENVLEVEVPNTLSFSSSILLFLGIIILTLGIAIFVYVLRQKKNI